MIIYKIRVIKAKTPNCYIGKNNPYYGFISDLTIKENKIPPYIKHINENENENENENYTEYSHNQSIAILFSLCDCFLVNQKYAKLFDNPINIKRLHTYCGGGTTGRSSKNATFSHYEVEIDDNGTISYVQLDQFIKTIKTIKNNQKGEIICA